MMQNQQSMTVSEETAARPTRSFRHHPVFYNFRRWRGFVPKGFCVNFLGVLTDVSVCHGYEKRPHGYVETSYTCFEEEYEQFAAGDEGQEYFEWIDLLEAVTEAEREFTMLELGAGWGRWIVNAAAALKQYNSELPYRLIAVEAEPTHFRWMSEHVRANGLDLKKVQLVEAAVNDKDGTVGFYVGDSVYGGPADWYGQTIGGSSPVRAIALNTLLKPLPSVDLIDLDIQGSEFQVLQASQQQLEQKVKRVHIATHTHEIESGLRDLFTRMGWIKLRDYPCLALNQTEYGFIRFRDGMQVWLNPRLTQPRSYKQLVARHLLDTVGFALEVNFNDQDTEELLDSGVLKYASTELISHLLRPGDLCIDAGCGNGYFTCLMAKLTGPQCTVMTFDPDPVTRGQASRNLTLNGLDKQAEILASPAAIHAALERRNAPSVRLLRLALQDEESIGEMAEIIKELVSRRLLDFVLLSADEGSDVPKTAFQVNKILGEGNYRLWESVGGNGWAQVDSMARPAEYLFSAASAESSIPRLSLVGCFRSATLLRLERESQNEFLEETLEQEQLHSRKLLSERDAQRQVVASQQQFSQKNAAAETGERQAPTTRSVPDAKNGFSPATALWNQRGKLASMRPKIEQLYAAIANPGEFSLYQWAQLTAVVLEFRPDLIIELGRGMGSSTACFLEAIHELGTSQCKLLSISPDSTWRLRTVQRIKDIVSDEWFQPCRLAEENILTFDFQSALAGSKRCLVFWDAHGFEIAECVLGGLLPLLLPRAHLVLMHDLSDLRYSSPDPSYGTNRLWMGEAEVGSALWLNWVFSRVPQSIAALDFTTRNKIPLHSADENLHQEIASDQMKADALQSSLGYEMGALQSHWFWFTLNEAPRSVVFPSFSPEVSLQRLQQRTASEAASRSLSWRLLQRWWKLTHLVAPAGSMLRRVYNKCLRRLTQPRSR